MCIGAAIALGRLQTAFAQNGQVDPVTRLMRVTFAWPGDVLSVGARESRTFLTSVWSVNRLVEENRRLRDEVEEAKSLKATEEQRKEELSQLRALMQLPDYGRTKVPAHVTGSYPGENRIKLSVGSKQGVKPGQPVVTGAGLVGQVSSVESGTCNVTLINAPRLSVSALLQSNGKFAGLLHGETANTLVMDLVDTAIDPHEGDAVTTSGMSEAYPRGILIGYVIKVRSTLDAGTRRAYVAPRVRFEDLTEVFVLK